MIFAESSIPRWLVPGLLAIALAFAGNGMAAPKKNDPVIANDNSDLNEDGKVDYADLVIFSAKYLEQNIDDVDWCEAYEVIAKEERLYGKKTGYYKKHFGVLLGFIYDYYECDGGPVLLAVVNQPQYAARIAFDNDTGYYYVTDPRVGSVFIYDPNWLLVGELKGLEWPLGVAIDSQGHLLVGSNGQNIEVYDRENGDLLWSFGSGLVRMPTAITIGPDGDIYVTDSKRNTVWVFDASYDEIPLRTIGAAGQGDGHLNFPTDTEIIERDVDEVPLKEVFIADQGNHLIKVFDTHGNFVRSLEPPNVEEPAPPPEPGVIYDTFFCMLYGYPRPGMECPPVATVRGSYHRLQALGSDSFGRLHVLDSFDAIDAVVDPVSGELIEYFSSWGEGQGLVKVPTDVLVINLAAGLDQAVVTDGDEDEIEIFDVVAPDP
jgi:Uma2 family endonuclease